MSPRLRVAAACALAAGAAITYIAVGSSSSQPATASAATAPAATAAGDPVVVRDDLGKELHAGRQIDVLGLAEIDADRIDAQMIMPGRHIDIKGAARLRYAGDRAVQAHIGGGEARIGLQRAIPPNARHPRRRHVGNRSGSHRLRIKRRREEQHRGAERQDPAEQGKPV